jgi:hypothetical protein
MEWIFNSFHPNSQSDPLVVGPQRDPDGDRITNLLERAFHLDPMRPGPQARPPGSAFGGLPVPTPNSPPESNRVSFEFVRLKNPAATGLSYLPELGSNLESFPDAGTILSTGSVDNDWEKVEFGGPSGSPRGFGRVRVEMLDP